MLFNINVNAFSIFNRLYITAIIKYMWLIYINKVLN